MKNIPFVQFFSHAPQYQTLSYLLAGFPFNCKGEFKSSSFPLICPYSHPINISPCSLFFSSIKSPCRQPQRLKWRLFPADDLHGAYYWHNVPFRWTFWAVLSWPGIVVADGDIVLNHILCLKRTIGIKSITSNRLSDSRVSCTLMKYTPHIYRTVYITNV